MTHQPVTPRARGDSDAPHLSPVTPAEDARTILINQISWGAVLAGIVMALTAAESAGRGNWPCHGRSPSEGLAPIIIQGVWEAIGRLKEEGLSILLVEQNASLALKLVDYVHVMSKGRVVYSARPEELRANDEIKSSYLGI
jgi:hypothetical protein